MSTLLRLTSIRTRLLVAFLGMLTLGFAALTLLAGGQITSSARTDYEQRLQSDVQIIAQALADNVLAYHDEQINFEVLESIVNNYEDQAGGQLTLYAFTAEMRVEDWFATRPAFRDMPEMEAVLRGEIVLMERRAEDGTNTLYTAAPVLEGRQLLGIVQLGVSTENIGRVIAERWAILGSIFVLLTALTTLGTLWLSRSIIEPLYRLRNSAVRLASGDFSHRVDYKGHDEVGEVAHAFNEMAHQVESMLEEQRAFASNTSHELRTPLTTIRLRSEALRRDPTLDDTTATQYITEIDDEVARLGDLVQDLTLLSRFDAGRAELGEAEIELDRLVAALHGQVAPAATAKDITLDITPPDASLTVHASLNHLLVVFRNILDNAIKYTLPGGTISWRIEPTAGGIHSTIRDSGQGIAAADLPHVFERFYRSDKARSRAVPGTGLGLSLTRSIVEAYGGQITIVSDGPGQGTTVQVAWPYHPQPQHHV